MDHHRDAQQGATPRSRLKREAVLSAAVAEFQELGFARTSMDRVAQRAEVSKRTVYNHFASKDDLFREVIRELLDMAFSALDVVYDRAAPLELQLTQLGEQEMALLVSPSFVALSRVAIAETIHSPHWWDEIDRDIQKRENVLVEWIRAAEADGRLDVDEPQLAAGQFMSLLKAFALWPQVHEGRRPPSRKERNKIIDSTVEMFLARYA